jgi:hypothetical protein
MLDGFWQWPLLVAAVLQLLARGALTSTEFEACVGFEYEQHIPVFKVMPISCNTAALERLCCSAGSSQTWVVANS